MTRGQEFEARTLEPRVGTIPATNETRNHAHLPRQTTPLTIDTKVLTNED